jgi:hypothetical protein
LWSHLLPFAKEFQKYFARAILRQITAAESYNARSSTLVFSNLCSALIQVFAKSDWPPRDRETSSPNSCNTPETG